MRIFYPRYSIYLISILFVTTLITLFWDTFYDIVLLRPSDLNSPKNWYRFFTYPLYINGLWTWFLTSVSVFVCGGIIEKRTSRKFIISLILFSTFFGGLIYAIINQDHLSGNAMGTAHMISWGYSGAAIVIGLKFWKELNLLEKIVLGLTIIGLFFISRDDLGFYIATIAVIVSVLVFTLFMKIKNMKQL